MDDIYGIVGKGTPHTDISCYLLLSYCVIWQTGGVSTVRCPTSSQHHKYMIYILSLLSLSPFFSFLFMIYILSPLRCRAEEPFESSSVISGLRFHPFLQKRAAARGTHSGSHSSPSSPPVSAEHWVGIPYLHQSAPRSDPNLRVLISNEKPSLPFWVARGLLSDPVSTLGVRRGTQIWSWGPEGGGTVLTLTVVPCSEVTTSHWLSRGSWWNVEHACRVLQAQPTDFSDSLKLDMQHKFNKFWNYFSRSPPVGWLPASAGPMVDVTSWSTCQKQLDQNF